MTTEEREALVEAAEKATPGPWRFHGDAGHPGNRRIRSDGRSHIAKIYALNMGDEEAMASLANAALIALANPSAILSLEAALTAAEAKLVESEAREGVLAKVMSNIADRGEGLQLLPFEDDPADRAYNEALTFAINLGKTARAALAPPTTSKPEGG